MFAISTLHCNDRKMIFKMFESFLSNVEFRNFTWVIFSQGCSVSHNQEIRHVLDSYKVRYDLVEDSENKGWSYGMNRLYEKLLVDKYEFVMHIEDDWIYLPNTLPREWLGLSLKFLDKRKDVSTLFLRRYKDDHDKWQYGWKREIHYMCFTHPHPFNYSEKMKNIPVENFEGLELKRIPEFLFTANPTIFRLIDYYTKGVFPFPMFDDKTMKRDDWATTTSADCPTWGYSEALTMEKIRDLVAYNVGKGCFAHQE